jgi:ADP-ribose pyrophosphatase YjhB (NUDIX family)
MKKGVDYIGVTVVFYCHDSEGNLLLHKRSQNCRDEQGRWDCGGGAMEFGETFEEAVRREIREEYCCDVLDLKFACPSNVIREHEGAKTHWIAFLFSALVDRKKVRIGDPEKMEELGWFKENELPNPLHSMYLQHLEMVKKST